MIIRALPAGLPMAAATSGAVVGSTPAVAAAVPDGLQAPSTADVFTGSQADLDRLADK